MLFSVLHCFPSSFTFFHLTPLLPSLYTHPNTKEIEQSLKGATTISNEEVIGTWVNRPIISFWHITGDRYQCHCQPKWKRSPASIPVSYLVWNTCTLCIALSSKWIFQMVVSLVVSDLLSLLLGCKPQFRYLPGFFETTVSLIQGRTPKTKNLFIKNYVFILTRLNFSHLQKVFSIWCNDFDAYQWFWCLLALWPFFVSPLPHRQNISLWGLFFLQGNKIKDAEGEIG